MNRFKKGAPETEQENKECEMQGKDELKKEIELQKESIEQYLNGLLPELNLRLFLEMPDDEAVYVNNDKISSVIKFPKMMLWAESITVTSYSITVNANQPKRRIFNRLMGRRMGRKSFTLKKYKKEGR